MTDALALARGKEKALACFTMASISTAEANNGQQEHEQDFIVVPLLTMVTIFLIAFFILSVLARMC